MNEFGIYFDYFCLFHFSFHEFYIKNRFIHMFSHGCQISGKDIFVIERK